MTDSDSGSSRLRDVYKTHTGKLSQVGGITPFRYDDGKAKGTSALRVRTATGLEFWVLPDRGMDVFEASYKGKSLAWHSPTGVVHPSLTDGAIIGWLRGFAGGLICTCGLSTAGAPSVDEGEQLALHGPISATPAEQVNWSETWQGDDCTFSVSGVVREASVFGPNLTLTRTIKTSLRSSFLTVTDSVENVGTAESPLMLLYHLNFGFPLLTASSEIHARSRRQEPATADAASSQATWHMFEPPQAGISERVYFHTMEPDEQGSVTVVLVSDGEHPDFGIQLTYDARALPEFVQWKMTGVNHYVLGLEPANCRSLGRAAERARGTLQFLAPGERRDFQFQIAVLDGMDAVRAAIESIGE